MTLPTRLTKLESIFRITNQVVVLVAPGESVDRRIAEEKQRAGKQHTNPRVHVEYLCSRRGDELFDPIKSPGYNLAPRNEEEFHQ